ncbi:MAG TPA: DUF4386 family protein [Terriglobia bacterium]
MMIFEHCGPSRTSDALLCYLIEFIEDIVIAWALYVLLVPVNRAVSLPTGWFRLMYTATAFFRMLKLVTVFRVVDAPDYTAAFGSSPLHAEVKLLLDTSAMIASWA